MLGIALILILIGIVVWIWKEICWWTRTIAEFSYWAFMNAYKYLFVERPLEKSGYLERKRMEQEMVNAEKEQRHKEQILNQQNRIIQAGLNNVREFRVRYPYADEYLFDHFLRKFPEASVDEIKEFENKIRESHLKNELRNSIDIQPQITYTMADLNGVEPLEVYREEPLLLKIYKMNCDYLLLIQNLDEQSCQLIQSKDYLVIARLIAKIFEKQKQLKVYKMTIKAEQIDELNNIVSESVVNYRRNNMGFLQ